MFASLKHALSLSLSLSLRRTGYGVTFPVSVNFTTLTSDTVVGADCFNTSQTSPEGDFCYINERIVFEPQTTKMIASVEILDDSVAEGEEELQVELQDPRGCLLPVNTKASRWIEDPEDCEYIYYAKGQFSRFIAFKSKF